MGLGSRREIETWIVEGRVTVNQKSAVLGQRIHPGDRVRVNGKLVSSLQPSARRLPRVLLYHKPEGEIVSRADPQGRPSIFGNLPRIRGGRWIAVGRLDFNSCGLLLLTSSGALANQLMHPRQQLERDYAVRVLGELSESALEQLRSGVPLDDGIARFLRVDIAGGEGANRWYNVTLAEGRNREIRRMFEAIGVTVSRLMRVRYGPLVMPARLKRGRCMELSEKEVTELLRWLSRHTPADNRYDHPRGDKGA